MKTIITTINALLMLVFFGDEVLAFVLAGNSWPGATATFNSKGFRGSNSTFDSAFDEALQQWNGNSNFNFSSISASVDPCGGAPNSTRGWEFDSDHCGTNFGVSVVAIAISWFNANNEYIDGDIVFDSTETWDVHDGPGANVDFRRIAVHELGHILGLKHENTNPAIMQPVASDNIETPQTDDINGLRAIYGGTVTSVIWVDFNYTGTELGTESQPYNTLAEAINAVAEGGEIIIKGGVTSETFTGLNKIEKNVTIRSSGGRVIIGAQ